jgi:hypothetical protein
MLALQLFKVCMILLLENKQELNLAQKFIGVPVVFKE